METKKVGRPKGTTKENNKKMYSFRLSEEELKAVREVLAKMRDKFILLFCLLSFMLPCGAFEYTIDTAREEALKDIPKFCPFPDVDAYHRAIAINSWDEPSVVSKQNRADNPKLMDVVYKETPSFTYTYRYQRPTISLIGGHQGLIVSVAYKANKANNKIAAYKANTGKLLTVAFNVSDSESYMFDMDGNLIGYVRGDEQKRYKIPYSTIKKHSVKYSGR